jgi:exosome complex component RRP41
VDFEEKG